MAAQQAVLPMNGNYAAPDNYQAAAGEDHPTSHAHLNAASTSGPAPNTFGSQNADVPANAGQSTGGGNHAEVPKDEVGWYFVEQYYTNLSRCPDKLHLFYAKRSQFVFGEEAEKAPVAVGRTAISEAIKKLDFQDCKVRVANVDSQASFNNIVIQVIGEISNKSAPHRKFVQTFVLAEQPNGYFVLNDIFRYIHDEDEEEPEAELEGPIEQEPAMEHQEQEQHQQASTDDEVKVAADSAQPSQPVDDAQPDEGPKAADVDEEQPQEDQPSESTAPAANGVAEDSQAESAPAAPSPDAKDDEPSLAESDKPTESADERPAEPAKEPEPAPVATPQPRAAPDTTPAATPPAPPKPAAPKTWANLVAASSPATPTTPSTGQSSSPVPNQPRAAPPPPSSVAASASPADSNDAQPSPTQQGANAGWQTAGTDHGKRQGRPAPGSMSGERDKVLAYVKNVTDKVSTEALKSELLKYGDLAYFDISRQKNCAFVEFTTPAGYSAAVAANPHPIGGEQIYVEERRPRSGAYGSGFYSSRGDRGRGRGGAGPDGRGGHPGRGGPFQKDGGPRGGGGGGGGGGYGGPGRARGSGTMTPRGRGGSQGP